MGGWMSEFVSEINVGDTVMQHSSYNNWIKCELDWTRGDAIVRHNKQCLAHNGQAIRRLWDVNRTWLFQHNDHR